MAENKQAIFTQKIASGLLLMLFFSLSFIALGYAIALSLLLGFIGAASGMFIVTWWFSDRPAPAGNDTASQSGKSRDRNKKRTNAPDVIEAQRLRLENEQERKKQKKQEQGSGKQRSMITALFRRFR
ncbi:MAG: hypothetical protein ACPGVO_13595 [Spirulinaceae cyanobacterium]